MCLLLLKKIYITEFCNKHILGPLSKRCLALFCLDPFPCFSLFHFFHLSLSPCREFYFSVFPLPSPPLLPPAHGECVLGLSEQLYLSRIRALECNATSQSTVSSGWRAAEGTLRCLTSKYATWELMECLPGETQSEVP